MPGRQRQDAHVRQHQPGALLCGREPVQPAVRCEGQRRGDGRARRRAAQCARAVRRRHRCAAAAVAPGGGRRRRRWVPRRARARCGWPQRGAGRGGLGGGARRLSGSGARTYSGIVSAARHPAASLPSGQSRPRAAALSRARPRASGAGRARAAVSSAALSGAAAPSSSQRAAAAPLGPPVSPPSRRAASRAGHARAGDGGGCSPRAAAHHLSGRWAARAARGSRRRQPAHGQPGREDELSLLVPVSLCAVWREELSMLSLACPCHRCTSREPVGPAAATAGRGRGRHGCQAAEHAAAAAGRGGRAGSRRTVHGREALGGGACCATAC
jgi:hypothetical protein